MSDNTNAKVFITQLTEKQGKYGTFYSGKIGNVFVNVAQSKTPGKWNMYYTQAPRQQGNYQGQQQGNYQNQNNYQRPPAPSTTQQGYQNMSPQVPQDDLPY